MTFRQYVSDIVTIVDYYTVFFKFNPKMILIIPL